MMMVARCLKHFMLPSPLCHSPGRKRAIAYGYLVDSAELTTDDLPADAALEGSHLHTSPLCARMNLKGMHRCVSVSAIMLLYCGQHAGYTMIGAGSTCDE